MEIRKLACETVLIHSRCHVRPADHSGVVMSDDHHERPLGPQHDVPLLVPDLAVVLAGTELLSTQQELVNRRLHQAAIVIEGVDRPVRGVAVQEGSLVVTDGAIGLVVEVDTRIEDNRIRPRRNLRRLSHPPSTLLTLDEMRDSHIVLRMRLWFCRSGCRPPIRHCLVFALQQKYTSN